MQMELFEFLPEEEAKQYKPLPSTDWKWTMANDYPKEMNGLKVFSCFACGGGSTMGYKLAGCEVLGCNEIDPRMNKVYVENHHPKYNYLEDIRDFNKREDLPEELYDLDILDGSPPCTTFSMAGDREESWGKKKKFREGQVEQTLDDLSFVFIETVAKLRPKVMIMENVEGLIRGEAWKYVQRIYKELDAIGYKCKHWLLKGETMGVPQQRHRVFFVATRLDFCFDNINFEFHYSPILFKDVKEGIGDTPKCIELLNKSKHTDKCLADILQREEGRYSRFNEMLLWDDEVAPTIKTSGYYRANDKQKLTKEDFRNLGTFPSDYNFGNQSANYIVGMSVPPIMTKRVVDRIIKSGIFDYKLKEKNND